MSDISFADRLRHAALMGVCQKTDTIAPLLAENIKGIADELDKQQAEIDALPECTGYNDIPVA